MSRSLTNEELQQQAEESRLRTMQADKRLEDYHHLNGYALQYVKKSLRGNGMAWALTNGELQLAEGRQRVMQADKRLAPACGGVGYGGGSGGNGTPSENYAGCRGGGAGSVWVPPPSWFLETRPILVEPSINHAEAAALKEASIWRTRAQAAEKANAELSLRLADLQEAERARATAPKHPHPHAALHRAIGVSENGGHGPQHNQVYWDRLP